MAEAPCPQQAAYDQSAASNSGSGVPAASVERIVIQNADLAIVVSDVEGRMKNIQIMAQQMGGFVVSSNLYQSYTSDYVEVPEAQITIRVPAENLEDCAGSDQKRCGRSAELKHVQVRMSQPNMWICNPA